jgi:cyclophilin family peptidyl-prolyl cis-trans isomerase
VPSADKRQRKKDNARAAREARAAAEKRSKRLRTFRNVGIVVGLFVVVIVLVNVVSGGSKKKASSSTTIATTTPTTTAHTVSAPDYKLDPSKTYTANITTNYGPITIKLDTKKAPVAAGHFIKLAKAGFYNGSRWHRVAKDYVIQGGAPGGDPNKSYGHSVIGETPTNNYPVGVIAAAKTASDPPGTFDSQFFIVTGSQGAALPNDYASFGTVTAGMQNVQKIAALVPASGDGEPTKKATIDKITITES